MEQTKIITTANASQCTPYELRQELIKRNAFDIDEKHANFRSMLQRLMVELVKEEELQAAERLQEVELVKEEELQAAERLQEKERENLQAREKAKQERERRKQEALEKSRQRREEDPDYLKKKAISIIESQKEAPVAPQSEEEEEEKEGKEEGEDVFRAYKSNGRTKVFVK